MAFCFLIDYNNTAPPPHTVINQNPGGTHRRDKQPEAKRERGALITSKDGLCRVNFNYKIVNFSNLVGRSVPELFPGSGVIFSVSGSSKNK